MCSFEYKLLSHPPPERKLLKDHLVRVANSSKKRVEETYTRISTAIPVTDLLQASYCIGAIHDLGKGTPFFQQYLSPEKIDTGFLKSHSMISSVYVSWLILNDSEISEANRQFLALLASLVIQGHHSGLKKPSNYVKNLDYFDDNNIFSQQMESLIQSNNIEELNVITTHDLRLRSFIEFSKSWQDHLFNFNKHILLDELHTTFNSTDKLESYFLINLLYSILLDADISDVAGLTRPKRQEITQTIIKDYISSNIKTKNSNDFKEINILRNTLFNHVDNIILNNDRSKIYTLTAATGLGKTLTSINFALNLRQQIELDKGYKARIIYVAPFLSILDQNMEVFQKVFNVDQKRNSSLILMHHHLAPINYHDDLLGKEEYSTSQSHLLITGWNAEIIVTTFIQFFNSVFSRYASYLRRLNNLVGSIVILDEIQSVRPELWEIIRKALLCLTNEFNVTIILMTATQPHIFTSEAKEIASTNTTIKNMPQRVSFQLRNQNGITLDNFCAEMNKLIRDNPDKNIMIELNTIPTASKCFDKIHSDNHDIRFLSSQVIPKHRRPRINEIKEQLEVNNRNNTRALVLVTTQVVEAGVDLDFDIVVRDIGPIDSIVQSAGRCNRHGMRKASESLFYIYRIMDDRRSDNIPYEYAKYIYGDVAISIADEMLIHEASTKSRIDIHGLVDDYYTEIERRGSNHQSNEIYDYMSDLNYEEVSDRFELIVDEDYKSPLFVEFDDQARMIWERFVSFNKKNVDGKRKRFSETIQLRNDMEQYTIAVLEKELKKSDVQVIDNIYKINKEDIGRFYDKEKGFLKL